MLPSCRQHGDTEAIVSSRQLGPSWLCCSSRWGTGEEVSHAAWPPSSPNQPALPSIALSLPMVESPPGFVLGPARSRTCSGHRREKGKTAHLNRTQCGTCFAACGAITAPAPHESRCKAASPPAETRDSLGCAAASQDSGRDLPLVRWKRQPGCPVQWGLSSIGALP